jgi:hypothetical protein
MDYPRYFSAALASARMVTSVPAPQGMISVMGRVGKFSAWIGAVQVANAQAKQECTSGDFLPFAEAPGLAASSAWCSLRLRRRSRLLHGKDRG